MLLLHVDLEVPVLSWDSNDEALSVLKVSPPQTCSQRETRYHLQAMSSARAPSSFSPGAAQG